jgi:hypothetical protein
MDPANEATTSPVASPMVSTPGGGLTVESVADLLDVIEGADVRATIGNLEQTLSVLRPAAEARDALASVEPATLRAALLPWAPRRAECRAAS